MVIRRVSPWSCAKIAGLIYLILGVFFGGILSVLSVAGWAGGGEPNGLGAIFGLAAILVLPLLYGCMGFVTTAIMAMLYNALSGMVGGIEVEVG
jgi:hypothetical protein